MFFGCPQRIFQTSPKTPNHEFAKTASPTFAQSFCGELYCSISPKSPEYLFIRAAEIEFQNIPENGQTRIAQNGFPRFWTIFWKSVCEYAIHCIMITKLKKEILRNTP